MKAQTSRAALDSDKIIHKDRIYDSNETAALIGISRFTLEKWRSGDDTEGPAFIRLGRNVKYRGSDLLTWIEAMTVTPSVVSNAA